MKTKIVIFDGTDRSGKTTLCSKFTESFKNRGYDVLELFTENDIFREICQPFDEFRKGVSLSTRYDTIAASQLLHTARMMQIFSAKASKPNAIVVNRFFLSCLVNMKVLRPEQAIWNENEYILYAKAFMDTVSKFADIQYINIVFKPGYEPKEDNANPQYSLNHSQLVRLNEEYMKMPEHFVIHTFEIKYPSETAIIHDEYFKQCVDTTNSASSICA